MESVGHKSEIWVEKSHQVGDLELELVSWVEKELDPSEIKRLENRVGGDN